MRDFFRFTSMVALLFIVVNLYWGHSVYATEPFSDVPSDHWAYSDIMSLREMSVTNGIGDNQFGMGRQITRGEFVSFLSKLMNWSDGGQSSLTFQDVDSSAWYFQAVSAAAVKGAIDQTQQSFRPDQPITRAEIAVMLVNATGFGHMAPGLDKLSLPFNDVTNDQGYVLMASDFAIISGNGQGSFLPENTATREEAAAMMMRLYRVNQKLSQKTTFTNGFYAIRSAEQANYMQNFNAVSFGWSRLELKDGDVFLNITSENNNEYSVPQGFETPYNQARANGNTVMLMVTSNDCEEVISNNALRAKAIQEISRTVQSLTKDGTTIYFDGVVIDFENMKGNELKTNFSLFLAELKQQLIPQAKQIYVAVQPQRREGLAYYDAYDFKAIGDAADKVILMAHDYNAKSLTEAEMASGVTTTPLSPIDEVYYALRAITDPQSGVQDKSKILLQINFDIAQWKTKDGAVIHQTPYTPTYDGLKSRLDQGGVSISYAKNIESPYVTFHNTDDNTENIAWYEDAQSVAAKIRLAKLFDITGVSVWRLGNIPNYQDQKDQFFLNVLDTIFSL